MAMVVVKWSTCLPSTMTNWVRIPIKPTVFSVKFVFEKNKNKLKEARLVNFFKKSNKIHFKNALKKRLHVEMCSQEAKYGSRVDRTLNAPLCYEKEDPFVLFKEILWPNWVTKIRPTLASSLDPFSYKKFRVEKHSDWQKPVTWLAFNQSICFASYLSNCSTLIGKTCHVTCIQPIKMLCFLFE